MGDAPPNAADRLRSRLKDLEWTQADLAVAIGVAPPVVSRWLSGERVPSLEMAFRIQNSAVGIPADAWIEPDAPTQPELGADDSGEHSRVTPPPKINTA